MSAGDGEKRQLLNKAKRFIEGGYILGRGGFGVVYGNDVQDPGLAIKHSHQGKTTCRMWSSEYKKIAAVSQRLLAKNVRVLPHARLIDVKAYVENADEGDCYMIMERIQRPPQDVLEKAGIQVKPNSENLTFQMRLGDASLDMIERARGHFLGTEQLGKILEALGIGAREYLADLATAAGELLAAIHYAALNDATDVELLLHYDADDPETPIQGVFADFDQTGDMFDNSGTRAFDKSWALYASNIERMSWSIEAYPYFPEKDSDLWGYFKKGYLGFAGTVGKREAAAAEEVLARV